MKNAFAILALSAVVAAVGCQDAHQNDSTAANPLNTDGTTVNEKVAIGGGANLSSMDRRFMVAAGNGGAYEVKEGELALTKTSDANVRMIAQHMVDDHTKGNDALASIARRKGVAPAMAPSVEQEQLIGQLNQLIGPDFDREYLQQQRKAHVETIALFETEAANGNDRDVREFASDTLPTLRSHLQMINNQTGVAAANP